MSACSSTCKQVSKDFATYSMISLADAFPLFLLSTDAECGGGNSRWIRTKKQGVRTEKEEGKIVAAMRRRERKVKENKKKLNFRAGAMTVTEKGK